MRCRRIGKMKKIGIKEGEGRELMRSKMKIFEKGKGSKNRRRNWWKKKIGDMKSEIGNGNVKG